MTYAEYAKKNKIKLELSEHEGRAWRKMIDGKKYYFMHPVTKAGYDAAHAEMMVLKTKLSGDRPLGSTYRKAIDLYEQCLRYYEVIGTPASERQFVPQLKKVIELLNEEYEQPKLATALGKAGEYIAANRRFEHEFLSRPKEIAPGITHVSLVLSDKWRDRLSHLTPTKQEKEPQTIGHWLTKYLTATDDRVGKTITKGSADILPYKMANFENYADKIAHVESIGNDYLTKYHDHISKAKIATSTKVSYFANFKMFLRWMIRQERCDFKTIPTNIDSPELGFREEMGTGRKRMEKKKLLWTPADLDDAMKLPAPYPCYVLLFLNCGMRHTDAGNLRKTDVDLESGRIIYQREKLSQQESAPVVSYKLWDKTIEKMKECMSDDPVYFFRNKKGGSVQKAIKEWWKRSGIDKRLDYLRKTGSTLVSEYRDGLDTLYLGDVLGTTAKIHYSFNDGEINPDLDRAIEYIGSKFGFCKPPAQKIALNPEQIEFLKANGLL